ncbi:MAG: hypothetical protein JSW52_10925 [Candidatus Coatesbacteria bacterium]|nr:MAG: hypothetical protein JSW52_10925 [Candidatus Coatesbacteria bacterium]
MGGNNGFKEFVRAEIRNVKDAAERNYEEHKALFDKLAELAERVIAIEALLESGAADRKSRRAMWAVVLAALITALGGAFAAVAGRL